MGKTMTLERVRDWHATCAVTYERSGESALADQHRNLAAAITAHLAQPAQAVDVERVAQLIAHRACCGTEADPLNGKLHGYCVVCGVPWPCEYAGTPPTRALSGEKAGPVGDGVVRVQVRSPITGKYVWMNALLPASPTPDKEGA